MKNRVNFFVGVLLLVGTFGINESIWAQTGTITPSALNFGIVTGGSTSSTMNFVFTGTYLSPASGTITVTAPSNYEVNNGSYWASSFTIAYSGSVLTAVTVPVHFVSPSTCGAYSGNVTFTGGSLSTVNGPVTGISSSSATGCSGTTYAGFIYASPSSGCGTYTSTLSLACASSGSGAVYQWQMSSTGSTWTNISGATGISYTTAITSSIYFRCAVTCTASSSTAYTSSVYMSTSAAPTVTPISGPSTVAVANVIVLANSTSGGSWTSSNPSVATVGSASGVVAGASAGSATISYAVTNSCGTTTVTKAITVTSALSVLNGSANIAPLINIYPNPATNNITLTANNIAGGKVSVKCYSLVGALLFDKEATVTNGDAQSTFDLSSLKPGIYEVVLQDEQGQRFVRKVVKE